MINNFSILVITVRTFTILFTLILVSLTLVLTSSNLYAEKRQTIRFYKLNSKDQAVRLMIRDKTAKKSGCHNFKGKKRIFRLTQIGFEYCTVYSEKNCAADSEVNGFWDESESSNKLTEGGEWVFTNENPKGHILRSWSCE